MGDLSRTVIAVGGCFAFIALALLTWIAIRLEQVRRGQKPPEPLVEHHFVCDRLHASEVAERALLRERALAVDLMTAEDLPGFRPRIDPRSIDEEEVNPRLSSKR